MPRPEEEIEYVITVSRQVTFIEHYGTTYENLHKKDERGEDLWGSVPKAPYRTTDVTEVFKQTTKDFNQQKFIMAVNFGRGIPELLDGGVNRFGEYSE